MHRPQNPSAWSNRTVAPRTTVLGALRLGTVILVLSFTGLAQETPRAKTSKDYLVQAGSLLHSGKPAEALAVLNDLAAKEPSAAGLEAMMGKACFQSKKFSEAIAHLQRALKQNPDDWESTQILALTFYATGDYQRALPLLESLGPHLPKENADGPYLLGTCYVMTQRFDDARRTFAQMFSVAADSSMAHLMFGKMLIRLRMEERAIPEIEKALELDPRLPMAHFLLGELDLSKKNSQEAVNEFQKELAINPSVWLVYWRLGDAYVRLENYDEAERVLKQAIWLNEWSSGAYILLGQIALRKGDSDVAVGFLERALKLDPQNYWVHYFLAKAYHNVGRTAEANQHFEISKSLRNEQLTDDRSMLQTAP